MSESSLSLKEKNTQYLFLLPNCTKVLNIFMTYTLNIIFDDFDVWLYGYRIEFSCLYIPQGHYFI